MGYDYCWHSQRGNDSEELPEHGIVNALEKRCDVLYHTTQAMRMFMEEAGWTRSLTDEDGSSAYRALNAEWEKLSDEADRHRVWAFRLTSTSGPDVARVMNVLNMGDWGYEIPGCPLAEFFLPLQHVPAGSSAEEVLEQSGWLWDPDIDEPPIDDPIVKAAALAYKEAIVEWHAWSPEECQGIPLHKIAGNNNGWHVLPEEIEAALARWEEIKDDADRITAALDDAEVSRELFDAWLAFLASAAERGNGFVTN